MDPLRMIAELEGVFLTQEALGLGYTDKAITREVREGRWTRVRRGAYVPTDIWSAAEMQDRHLIIASAVHRSYGDSVAFSHVTAALMQGVRVWGVDLSRVHVTRLDTGVGRIERDVVHHEPHPLISDEVDRVDGRLVVPAHRAALQVGTIAPTEQTLVALDSVLHLGLASRIELENLYDTMQRWPHSQRLQIALRMADAGGQSVGESRMRWMFRCAGIPRPELQFVVRASDGELIGTTDFAWPAHRLLGEFDGRVKYGRFLRAGESAGDAVFREKVREDALRQATGYGMFRGIWVELDDPATPIRRLRHLLNAAA